MPKPVDPSPEFPEMSMVPNVYLDLKEVFNKDKNTSLPPYCRYDCAIELILGMAPPKGPLYSLSAPEMKAMDKYIQDTLPVGIIRPSSPLLVPSLSLWRRRARDSGTVLIISLNDIVTKLVFCMPTISSGSGKGTSGGYQQDASLQSVTGELW